IVHYDQLGIYRLLEELRHKPEMNAFMKDTIQPLIDYDRKNKTELVRTIRQFYAQGGNLGKAAQELFVHYNTVLYRLKRVEEILGISLGNSQQRLSLGVAVKALELK
ncbi:MAG: PucR family transcriptional regulator, partial [Firmicutes bacterium]|nr:PucR family transcriptional regulator [Bacillota bacterium]